MSGMRFMPERSPAAQSRRRLMLAPGSAGHDVTGATQPQTPEFPGHLHLALCGAVLATSRWGKSVRIIVDARVGKVLSVQQVIAVIPPGPYPVRQPVDVAVPRPYAPDEIRTPGAGPLDRSAKRNRQRSNPTNRSRNPPPRRRARIPRWSPSAPRVLLSGERTTHPAQQWQHGATRVFL
jgi:hypothetical protein